MHLFIYELDNLGVVAVNVIFFVWAGAGGVGGVVEGQVNKSKLVSDI